jgi:hypothetical protein
LHHIKQIESPAYSLSHGEHLNKGVPYIVIVAIAFFPNSAKIEAVFGIHYILLNELFVSKPKMVCVTVVHTASQ